MTSSIPYGPHWFAAVMGTGIVAVALTGLPEEVPGRTAVAVVFWLGATVLLALLALVLACEWRSEPGLLRRHFDDPLLSHFYGAPAMALMTVGAGALAVGHVVIGDSAALAVDWLLWSGGTLVGLWTAVAVPVRAITHHDVADDSATGGWLIPVVPPMVSAATGAALVRHLPPGQGQETMLLFCYALFGLTLITAMLVLGQLWQRLVRHGELDAATTPTVWIALGFLGQSVTAAHHLGTLAPTVVPEFGQALRALTITYGVPVWGFSMLWVSLAVTLTLRQVRVGMPYAPSWWSFTFPVGTVVTATSGLAATLDLPAFRLLSVVLMLGLLLGWSVAAGGTLRAFRAPRAPGAPRVAMADAVGDARPGS